MEDSEYMRLRTMVDAQLDVVRTRRDFAAFLRMLADMYDRGMYEEQPIWEFINGIHGGTGYSLAVYGEVRSDVAERPDWRVFGTIDHLAFIRS